MAAYKIAVDAIGGHFLGFEVEHINIRLNEAADALSQLGLQRKAVPPNVFQIGRASCRERVCLYV